jgi:hypothetical protein
VDHTEGKGGERVVAVLRFQCGSPRLCRLRTTSFCPLWTSFDLYWPHVGFMGPGEPSSPVTTLLNRPSLLRGGLLEGEWDSPGRRSGWTIAGGQDFIPGARVQFQLSRDFVDGCRTRDPRGQAYDVLVRFFSYMVYTDSNHRDTLEYEWLLAHCCHLVVCLVVFDEWIRGWLWLRYHGYYCINLIILLITFMMLVLCML